VRAAVSENLIGASDVMNQLRRRIERIGPSLLPVLIQGETGSGKELVAQGLHRHSARRPGPLVVLNCAAIASTLLETELFGHTRGSFTGAVCDRPGLFQQADEGTLFLDEIGEMSPECQGKLLRVIEGKSFRPVGGSADVQVDVRIIAATHRDLERQVELGKFRQDLFFRLDGARIMAPPLREHSEDIPALVDYFLSQVAAACGRHVHMTPPAIARLQEYLWPGNVRQLRAVLENAVVMSESNEIDAGDLLMPSTGSRVCRGSSPLADALPDFPSSLKLAQIEAWAIRKALRETASHAQAAELLGIARETLYKKRKKYKLDMEG
jgi:Nif-specific regulatory protein